MKHWHATFQICHTAEVTQLAAALKNALPLAVFHVLHIQLGDTVWAGLYHMPTKILTLTLGICGHLCHHRCPRSFCSTALLLPLSMASLFSISLNSVAILSKKALVSFVLCCVSVSINHSSRSAMVGLFWFGFVPETEYQCSPGWPYTASPQPSECWDECVGHQGQLGFIFSND